MRAPTNLSFDIIGRWAEADGAQLGVIETNLLGQLHQSNVVVDVLAVPVGVHNDLLHLEAKLVGAGRRLLVRSEHGTELGRVDLGHVLATMA